MVGSGTVNSESFKVTKPSDQEIRMTRLFDAPRHLVFEAMTKPEYVKQWWAAWARATRFPFVRVMFARVALGAS